MATLITLLCGLAAILGGFVWLARRMRRRGLGGAVMGPIDEIYQPSALRFRQEIQIQDERGTPRPSADGKVRP